MSESVHPSQDHLMSQFCIHISDAQHSHEWGYSPTVGTYTCMKCSERRNYNDPQYAEAEREYQAQVRNMQQSSDMVERVIRALDEVASDWLPREDQEKYARAALEASHHAELVEALKLARRNLTTEPSMVPVLSCIDSLLAKIGGAA